MFVNHLSFVDGQQTARPMLFKLLPRQLLMQRPYSGGILEISSQSRGWWLYIALWPRVPEIAWYITEVADKRGTFLASGFSYGYHDKSLTCRYMLMHYSAPRDFVNALISSGHTVDFNSIKPAEIYKDTFDIWVAILYGHLVTLCTL